MTVHLRLPDRWAYACCGGDVRILRDGDTVTGLPTLATCGLGPMKRLRRWFDNAGWSYRGRRFDVVVSLGSVNRPHVRAGWSGEGEAWASVEWGNRNSDPVWLVQVTFGVRPGSLLAKWVDHMEWR